jgi:hypothetical protein
MKEWGWTNPVLADEAGGVISGHARGIGSYAVDCAVLVASLTAGYPFDKGHLA